MINTNTNILRQPMLLFFNNNNNNNNTTNAPPDTTATRLVEMRNSGGDSAPLLHQQPSSSSSSSHHHHHAEEEEPCVRPGQRNGDGGVSFACRLVWTIQAMNGLLFLVSLALVSVLFASPGDADFLSHLTVGRGYALGPRDAGCVAWLDNECVKHEDEAASRQWQALAGTLPLSEHVGSGLFSENNPAVICLVAQGLFTAFDLCWAAYGTAACWMCRKVSLGLLAALAALLLFMQTRWRIPTNNLLWLELGLAIAFSLIGHGKHAYGRRYTFAQMRYLGLLGPAFATPMLGVAALAAAQESDVMAFALSYIALCGVSNLWLLDSGYPQEQEEAAAAEAYDPDGSTLWVTRVNMWLLLVPFTLYASLRLQTLTPLLGTDAVPRWAYAGLVLCTLWFGLMVAWFTLLGLLRLNWRLYGSRDCLNGTTLLFSLMHRGMHAAVLLLILAGMQQQAASAASS